MYKKIFIRQTVGHVNEKMCSACLNVKTNFHRLNNLKLYT